MGLEEAIQVRHLQQLLNGWWDITQLQVPMRFPGGGQKTDHGAQAAAVDECNVAQVQDEVLALTHHSVDVIAQGFGFFACDDPSTAMDNRDLAYTSCNECKWHCAPQSPRSMVL